MTITVVRHARLQLTNHITVSFCPSLCPVHGSDSGAGTKYFPRINKIHIVLTETIRFFSLEIIEEDNKRKNIDTFEFALLPWPTQSLLAGPCLCSETTENCPARAMFDSD